MKTICELFADTLVVGRHNSLEGLKMMYCSLLDEWKAGYDLIPCGNSQDAEEIREYIDLVVDTKSKVFKYAWARVENKTVDFRTFRMVFGDPVDEYYRNTLLH